MKQKENEEKELRCRQLKMIRLQKGLSQTGMAERIGVSLNTYCSWENGKWAPSARHWHIVCQMFGLREDTSRAFQEALLKNAGLCPACEHKVTVMLQQWYGL